MMNARSKGLIDRLIREYNPDRDMPHDPQVVVSWVEYDLVKIIEDLNSKIEDLRNRVIELEMDANPGRPDYEY